MKKLLVSLLMVTTSAFAQNTVDLSVYFDKNSDVPHMPEMAMLNDIAQHPNSDELRFSVVGFTDSKGSEEYNRQLAKRRTKAVVNHLLLSGIMPYNIIFEYEGEVCDDGATDEASLAKNRRVDIHISNVGKLEDEGFAGMYDESVFDRPLPTVNPDAEKFSINADEGSCIETASGTLIDIPPMAFMDAYGRPISGEVEIEYEEFNDPFAIFLSGITMKYKGNGKVEDFESAGMFSLTASQRNRPVELRPDRSVSLDFASVSTDDDFDFFFLDPNSGEWNDVGKAALREDEANVVYAMNSMSPAVMHYIGLTDFMSPSTARRMTLEDQFQNMQYMNGRPIASYYRFLRNGDQREKRKFRSGWNKQAGFKFKMKLAKLKEHPNTLLFSIDKRKRFTQNPELRLFNGRLWEYAGALSREQLRAQFHRRKFHNMRIRYEAGSETAILELKDLDSIVSVPVKKVAVADPSLDIRQRMWGEFSPTYEKMRLKSQTRQFDTRYKIYQRSLARQERQLQREADRFDKKSQREYVRSLKGAWKESKYQMHDGEKMMSFSSWNTYCENLTDEVEAFQARQQMSKSVIRSLQLDRMGIYNCDRIKLLNDPQKVEPRFVMGDGKAIYWEKAYAIHDNFNGVIEFWSRGKGPITIDPAQLEMILVIDFSGRTYRLNEAEVIAMNRGKVAHRIMHVTEFDHTPESLDDLRESLSMVRQ
ncbi:MAG: OmpA family protein [Flavobacteriales bacterium]|nr:OmpA family protein [Flavobacteriales bacterium]